ncbi:MAG: hypothetical protein KAJ40_03105, partial [Alphaproteobacteria bacterium]|nr:hypothetical protein [Alphaproteobacteria bacterium]
MTDKPVLFLDNDFLINTYNATGQNDTLFNQIMDTYAQEYDVQITKAVFDEAVDLNAINPATGEPYPKDVAINNWMDSQSITSIETNTALGPNAGERSIIDAIKNDPALYDSETGIARDGTYRVASNDASYNGTDTELFQSERVGAETLAKESTIKGNTSVENYKLLYENSSESTINWENYKDVFKETFETKYSDGTIEYTENADGTIDYTIKKGSSSIKIAESGLFVEADPNTKMA